MIRLGEGDLFGYYHDLIREAASRHAPNEWRADIERIVCQFDEDCRWLSRAAAELLRVELSTQLEHELLRCTDPAAASVLSVVLKHLDAP